MLEHRKEGRLSEDEALADVERVNAAAHCQKLPTIQELESMEDVQELEEMLEELGGYSQPTLTDVVDVGEKEIQRLRQYTLEKDPKEVHYQERSVAIVGSAFRDRFGFDTPEFPIERILMLTERDFSERHGRLGVSRDATGSYVASDKIVLLRVQEDNTLSERVHACCHELVHWAIAEQTGSKKDPVTHLKEVLGEAVTEQVALELSTELLLEDDLFEETLKWADLQDKMHTKEEYLKALPVLQRAAESMRLSTVKEEVAMQYSYAMERVLLESIAIAIQEDVGDAPSDILVPFVRALGGDIALLKKLVRDVYGGVGVRALFEKAPADRPLDMYIALRDMRKRRRTRLAEAG
ncbi:MAG: hypothetical protein ABIG71_03995 [Candidatus Uhrbacteria bacterium]